MMIDESGTLAGLHQVVAAIVAVSAVTGATLWNQIAAAVQFHRVARKGCHFADEGCVVLLKHHPLANTKRFVVESVDDNSFSGR